MQAWASSDDWNANFLCICVNGDEKAAQVATSMATQFQMADVDAHGYIDTENGLPTFGQLGCQGLVIVDDKGNFISRKTQALLKIGHDAFHHVERLLYGIGSYEGQTAAEYFKEPPKPELRFGVGAKVLCRLEHDEWVPGTITHVWVETIRHGEVPYEIELNNGSIMMAPVDRSDIIIAQISSPGERVDVFDDMDASVECVDVSDDMDEEGSEGIALPSVGVDVLDEEHAECCVCLQKLAEERTRASLLMTLEIFQLHFDHEEKLFEQTGFGNHGTAFSGTQSHLADHEAIILKMETQIERLGENEEIQCDFIDDLANHLQTHNVVYDALFFNRMPKNASAL